MIHIIEFAPDYNTKTTYPIEMKSAIVKFYEWQTVNNDIDIVSIQKDGQGYVVAYKKKIEKRDTPETAKMPMYDAKNAMKKR